MNFDGSRRRTSSAPAGTGLCVLATWALALVAVDVHAEISGPESASADFPFTLTWSHSTETTWLEDRSRPSTHVGGSATFVKSAGTHVFAEVYCLEIPSNDFNTSGQACVTVDTHTVVVTGRPARPAAPHVQAGYQSTLRTGDLDDNGRTDVLIERTTPGAVDRSFQTVVDRSFQTVMLMQDADGALTQRVPSPTELATALTFAENTSLSLDAVDFNVDGYVDQTVTGLATIGADTAGYLVFAPGGRRGRGPLAVTAMDDARFINSLTTWASHSRTPATGTGTSIRRFGPCIG